MTSTPSSESPLVSVISIVFNGAAGIANTIESVLAQDYVSIEYIVIDGASTDGTQDIVRSYANRLDAIVSECDDGIYDAMNKGLRLARGEYLLFMNCGDAFHSHHSLSDAMRYFKHGKEQILLGKWIRKAGEKCTELCTPDVHYGRFNHQAVLYSRSIHAWHGEYISKKGLSSADYLFFASLFSSAKVDCVLMDVLLAVVDVNGVSAGLQTVSQKLSIDFLLGRASKIKLVLVFLFHPLYYKIKTILRRRE